MAEREIQDTITIDAAPERVFRALTDSVELEHWLATSVESDARTGGRFRYEFEFQDQAQNNTQEGAYLDVEKDRRVRLPWRFPFSDQETTVEYALAPVDGSTRVDFAHSGFQEGERWDGAYERFTGGWRMFLEGLKTFVEENRTSLPFGMKSRLT